MVAVAQPVLSLAAVESYIGGSRILRGVTLDVGAGEVVALMGRNGVGKTTTLRAITGILPARAGQIMFQGRPLAHVTADERARTGIAYVPQGREIFPHLTVEENLRIGFVVHRRGAAAQREGLERVFTLFPVLREMLARKGGVLSGGQQQQLAIARALLTDPKLLLLDEPTEGIQPSIIEEIGATLKRLKMDHPMIQKTNKEYDEIEEAVKALKREGRLAILLVEQYVDFCREVADRFYAMDRGVVTISGPIATLTDEVVRVHLQV